MEHRRHFNSFSKEISHTLFPCEHYIIYDSFTVTTLQLLFKNSILLSHFAIEIKNKIKDYVFIATTLRES